ncbi:MAG: uroporphyrinogen decarboxylase family protein [candidate division Zixibacteria bacterium]|nr:uroporphyrinogen decarboxylase family protein [Candidatus Tariuqbacter arcticus]
MRGEMNPRERWSLLLIDEFPDRPPVFPLVTSHAANVFGCDLIQYCTDGKILAEAQLAAQRYYGHDGLSVFTDVGIIAEAFGSSYHLREFDVPILDQPVLSDLSNIDSLQIPDPGSNGRLPVYLEAIDLLFRRAGDVLPVFAYIPCPFTTAAGLRGVENFLIDTMMNPEAAHLMLDISCRAAERFCDECILAGALPILVDPLASGSVISRRSFKEFAAPYQRNLIRCLHRYDLDIMLHICGDTSNMLDLIPGTGADLFSFDQVDINAVLDEIGDRVRLVGNLPPNNLLASSSMSIEENTDIILSKGLKNPKGYVLSTGCEVPIKCEHRKLQAMINLGKTARYENGW